MAEYSFRTTEIYYRKRIMHKRMKENSHGRDIIKNIKMFVDEEVYKFGTARHTYMFLA